MEVLKIAQKIRQLRKKNGLTLDQMAEKTGLSKGYLSKIENAKNKHFPPFSTLNRIANALAVKVAWLLTDDEQPEAKYFILRKAERMPIVMKSGSTLFTKWPLANGKPGRNLNPSLIEIPFENEQIYHHDGEEFYFLLEGKIKFTYGKKEFVLEEGDCLYFDTDVPHTGYSLGKKKALALVILFNEYGDYKEQFVQEMPPYK
jgi:transcriptional regulator with XRE-family HTH domain